jgi:16S rRNA (cytidine1402-2'-O)-methyltransferase
MNGVNDSVGPSLVLVATPIGNLGDISPRALEELAEADIVACEDTRRTGSLFSHFGITHAPFIVCNEHTERAASGRVIDLLAAGKTVALVSDAGTPAVSDPGQRLVGAVIEAGHTVRSIPGASAVLVALTTSGLVTERFCFDGFLPRKGKVRARRIAALANEERTSVLFEAPHRLQRTVHDLEEALGPDRHISLARELTKRYEEIWRGSLSEAVAHSTEIKPRGEYVLVLEGATSSEVTEEQMLEALRDELEAGLSRRDAVAAVVALTGAKKRQVYDLALQLDD